MCRSKHRTPPVCLFVMSLLTAAGCSNPTAEAPKAPPANTPLKLTVVQPQKKAVRRVVEQPGTIQADEQTDLFVKLPGYVSKVHVDIGQPVKGPRFDDKGREVEPGEVLAELSIPETEEEAREKQALVRNAEAEAEQARKALVAAEANVRAAEAQVTVAKAGVSRAQYQYERWESESNRVGSLVKGGVIDAQTRDETQNQFRSTAAAVDEARANVLSAEAIVAKRAADRDKAAADVTAAEARVEVAKAAAARLQALLRYTRVRAPYDGVVTRRRVNTGDFLQPNDAKEGIFTVARRDPVRAVFEVAEADAGFVGEKSPVKVTVQSLPGPEIGATVTRTSWALQPGSRTLRVEIDLPNRDGRARPGMYATARITAELPEAWALPAAAVIKYGDNQVCYRVVEGKAIRTPVQVLRGDGQFTQVSKWQKPGTNEWTDLTGEEKVVVQAANVSDGQAVP
jgi:HlyD family secretion protein